MRAKAITLAAALSCASAASAQQPLSAIDWLSDVTTTPIPSEPATPPIEEEAVTRGVVSEVIQVTPLDAPSADSVGLLPASVSGLPRDLWGPTSSGRLVELLARINADDLLPATRDLLFTLLLAELDPPFGSIGDDFLLARIDTLTRLGAVEQAHAMLERAGIETAEQFAKLFDLSVFIGRESDACLHLTNKPGLAAELPVRIFCLARGGDWNAAALSFDSARVFGQLTPEEEAILTRFLDTELDDAGIRLPRPTRPNPLTFHLFEAIGEPLPTTTLPVAFAHTDLRAVNGWKVQVEAAERLARVGALPANRLLGLYTERAPAASGGVWDRVTAVQTFDMAVASGSVEAVAAALPVAWVAMQSVGLERTFAELYGDRLRLFEMPNAAGDLAYRVSLLSEDYEDAALTFDVDAAGASEALLTAIAKGDLSGAPPQTEMGEAIAEAFLATQPPARYAADLRTKAVGAAVLHAIDLIGTGQRGDLGKVTDALSLLRTLGLETVARRTALELLILDRRG